MFRVTFHVWDTDNWWDGRKFWIRNPVFLQDRLGTEQVQNRSSFLSETETIWNHLKLMSTETVTWLYTHTLVLAQLLDLVMTSISQTMLISQHTQAQILVTRTVLPLGSGIEPAIPEHYWLVVTTSLHLRLKFSILYNSWLSISYCIFSKAQFIPSKFLWSKWGTSIARD